MISPVRDRVLYYVNLYAFRISFGKVRIPHLFTELLGGKKKTDRPGEESCRIAAVSDAKMVKPSRSLLRPPLTATVNKTQRRRTISASDDEDGGFVDDANFVNPVK
ncbi:uncharacterized protein LOC127076411 [Lathyrus oleraceus]|uniref:uncharacterized protein LOC127076411 n=1 Tax=Pisum sativum TaxID=3888 RepID=UPI0021CE8FB0|nr:uncharacterized protein LOC127076411 [Pisum sativum]